MSNPLQTELLDLITLMPDSQTQEIIDYIMDLRASRARRDAPPEVDCKYCHAKEGETHRKGCFHNPHVFTSTPPEE